MTPVSVYAGLGTIAASSAFASIFLHWAYGFVLGGITVVVILLLHIWYNRSE